MKTNTTFLVSTIRRADLFTRLGLAGCLVASLLAPTARGANTFSATGSLVTGRFQHTATLLLPNGKVLVAGGNNGSINLASAEIYNPATGTWSVTGALATASSDNTATLLANGKVLVAAHDAELYDPAIGAWSVTGSLTTGRQFHTATLLPNGKVLVAGGAEMGPLASAELYAPATRMSRRSGSLDASR